MENNMYENALNNAVASVEMEGYSINKKQKELSLEFLTGKINKETFIELVLKGCKE